MVAIWFVYVLAAVAASGLVVAAGWRSNQAHDVAARDPYSVPDDPLWGDPEIDLDAADTRADVGGALRLALKRLAPVMASRAVKLDIAAPSGLLGRMRGAALADIVEELLAIAVHAAPAGRLLLTAATHGDRIDVAVTDDRPGADPAIRAANVRGLMERVALRGASLDIDVRPADGTTMTLRLASATWDRPDIKDRALPEPAKGAMAASIPFMGAASPS